jgi:hypothetical protein
MTIEIYAFRWLPPVAQGFVRDLRLRWACHGHAPFGRHSS